ncbi:DUF2927 domain-containing protein [Pseudooceanicola sp. LIPI14-2-Ac024]|uniref:DUF2927 domain-containing protein n=1 Tax=Pseudooceanicola sp. LIPI14-2-Ac024 TaxID=3344875 RepID=UPI0035D08102
MRWQFAATVIMALVGCQPAPQSEVPSRAAMAGSAARLPPMKMFADRPAATDPVTASNDDIARDFLDLSFKLESGRDLPVLTRFEGPITVRLAGTPPAGIRTELDRVLGRLRREAGLDIRSTSSGGANITIQSVSGDQIRRYLPQAACFVVPNVSSLAEYNRVRRGDQTSWSDLKTRERIAIFVPNDVSPQEVRDCLHEELAQAIGPLNDLYRLESSVFNDDNIHTVLTPFDMLILRTYYAPELQSGMSRYEVERVLPEILSRLNPAGDRRPSRWLSETPRDWIEAIQTALGPGTRPEARMRAATRALRTAESEGWDDHRLAFSHYAYARLVQASDPQEALRHYRFADAIYARRPETAIHRSFVRAQLAADALSRNSGDQALGFLRGQPELAQKYENAALLASLMMLQAQALDATGRGDAAQAIRRDSLGWARYGFGPDWAVRAKLSEIAMLSPSQTGG